MSLLRLVTSLSRKINEDGKISTDFDIKPNHHFEYIAPYLYLLPPIHPQLLSSGLEGLENLSVNLAESHSISFCDSLQRTIQTHQAKPPDGILSIWRKFQVLARGT